MLVTLDVLRKYGACEQWRKIFAYRFPKGLNIETRDDFIDALILGGMHPVAKWVVTLGIFDKIDLGRADLSRADLSRADLSGADLSGADLDGAYLGRANLSGANLSGADLSGADLSGADLSGADLSGAGLDGADLSGANLGRAYLGRADLSGANLSDVRGVKSAQLALAKNLDAAFPAALVEKESAELSAQTS